MYPRSKLIINSFMILMLSALVILPQNAEAQRKKKRKKQNTEETSKKKSKEKSIEDLTKSSEKIEGLFTIYRDTISGSIKMLISDKHLDKEYIYFNQISDGVVHARKIIVAYRD